jgi:hypothetical protein
MESQQHRRVRSKEEMYPLIEEWQQSGQSQKHFCEQKHLSKSVFVYWLKKYRKQQDSPSGFAAVEVTGQRSGRPYLEVEYPGGTVLRFFEPVSIQTVSRLLKG